MPTLIWRKKVWFKTINGNQFAINGFIAVRNKGRRFYIYKIQPNKWDLHDGCVQVSILKTLTGAKQVAELIAFK